MNNIAEMLASITISDEQLGLLFHSGPVEALCPNSMAQRSPAYMGTVDAFMHLFYDMLSLLGQYISLV